MTIQTYFPVRLCDFSKDPLADFCRYTHIKPKPYRNCCRMFIFVLLQRNTTVKDKTTIADSRCRFSGLKNN